VDRVSADFEAPVVFDGAWKQFTRGERHDTLRDLLPGLVRRFRSVPGSPAESRTFWALRDISFSVQPGEALGIIGPNGAGKSTILKLLSRIIRPTRGVVRVRGRVGTLIELAAGFHPDLTGRENVYLQGAIMGMPRAEIARGFEENVEFAGVGAFIDTPVKRYSSGMSARLGFAIAAHLDPDVLLIDEVLAVGDLAFQRKALGRLKEILDRDIAVVIVTHQLDRVVQLCDRALLLAGGAAIRSGPAAECVAAYIDGAHLAVGEDTAAPVRLHALTGPGPDPVRPGEPVVWRLRGEVLEPDGGQGVSVGLRVRRLPEEEILGTVHSAACDIVLPAFGPFDLEIAIQTNVGAGIFRVQSVVWRWPAPGTEWVRGPSCLLEVAEAPDARGTVYLRPSMRLQGP
jgi:ABC-type polysaccharide/polyol phosphate transport system ATPase subunit